MSLEALEQRIGYSFKNRTWLEQAMTHPSLAGRISNQRLEFLGDSVLGIIVAKLLFEMYAQEAEGDLARRQAGLVRSSTLADVARDIALGDALLLASSEEVAGGRDNPTNLEDALEALIGAMYLDGGLEAAEAFVLPRWKLLAKSIKQPPKDAKTALQEWAQGRGLAVPEYVIIATDGPAHAPNFTIQVSVQGYAPETAEAKNKRAAEQLAAEKLLEKVCS